MTRDRRILLLAGALWAGFVGYGMKALWDHRDTPGRKAAPSVEWPAGRGLRRPAGKATLVMLAHPACPCTRASLEELNVLMNRLRGRLLATVLFVKPREFAEGWEKTDSWRRAREIPGVTVLTDPDGAESRRFDGYTSGQVLVYSAEGQLLYNGGLTAGRGHAGAGKGMESVVSLVTAGKGEPVMESVFGCALFASTETGGEKP